jgi:hypothetical protein
MDNYEFLIGGQIMNSANKQSRRLSINRPTMAFFVIFLVSILAQACSSQADLAVGDQAPGFTLPSATGTDVSLSDYTGEGPVLLYFHMALG